MNTKKYLNFSFFFIILSFFDIMTTQYALSNYPSMREGNVIMALVTSSFLLFVFIKALGVMVIMGLYRIIKKQSATAAKIGQCIIIFMMLLVVGNNLTLIASATTYGFPSPYSLESPGSINIDGSQEHAFIGHNNYNVTSYFSFDTNTSNSGGLYYSAANKFYSNNMVRFAVLDWVHPQRMFLVFSNLDVAYTDSTGVIYENGYYADNVWPLTGCSNCNDLHKIGVLTELNSKMNGFVDSNGDLLLAEGVKIVKFIRASDYTKTTIVTAIAGVDYTASYVTYGSNAHDHICSFGYGDNNTLYVLICGYASIPAGHADARVAHLQQITYSGTTKIYQKILQTHSIVWEGTSSFIGSLLIPKNQVNSTTDIIYGWIDPSNVVRLRNVHNSTEEDICPTSCSIISDFDGLQIFSGYAYIASSSENKIYRFPTTIQVSSGTGYVPGQGQESTDQPDLTYSTKSINSLYANYYNTSKFAIQAKINFPSGNWPTSVNYGINDQAYRWQIKLIDPNGITVNSWDTGECDASGITHCELNIAREYNAPMGGWQAGNWYVKLYEHKIDTTLFGDAPMGNLALLTTSATWNVYNGSMNDNVSIITDPTEPITSESNQATIGLIDNIVGLMGFGINSVSKFLFSLLIIVILFVVGLWKGNGNIGLALSTLPYTFFTYINYIPKWVFIIYIIMLIIIAKVFR